MDFSAFTKFILYHDLPGFSSCPFSVHEKNKVKSHFPHKKTNLWSIRYETDIEIHHIPHNRKAIIMFRNLVFRKKIFTILFAAMTLPFFANAEILPSEQSRREHPEAREIYKSSSETQEGSTIMVASLIAAACLGKIAGIRQSRSRVFAGRNSHFDLLQGQKS